MATRIFGVNPGASTQPSNIVEAIGPVATSAPIAIVVDLANTVVNTGSTTRTVSKNEVLLALENFKEYILRKNWPPA